MDNRHRPFGDRQRKGWTREPRAGSEALPTDGKRKACWPAVSRVADVFTQASGQ